MKKLLFLFSFLAVTITAQAQFTATSLVKIIDGNAVSQATGAQMKTFMNAGTGTGTVTSVGISVPAGLTASSAITTSGTIAITNNLVAGIVKSAGVGLGLSSGNIALGSEVAGILPVANGGIGVGTLTGYVKGVGTAAMTASATIPTTDLSGTLTNAQLANSVINHTVTAVSGALGFTTTNTALGATATLNVPLAGIAVASGTVSDANQTISGNKNFVSGTTHLGSLSTAAVFINGAEQNKQSTLTVATTLDLSYRHVRLNATTAFTTTLPACNAANIGLTYNFLKTDASLNLATITTVGADVFTGGGTTRTLSSQNTQVDCTCGAPGFWDIKF